MTVGETEALRGSNTGTGGTENGPVPTGNGMQDSGSVEPPCRYTDAKQFITI